MAEQTPSTTSQPGLLWAEENACSGEVPHAAADPVTVPWYSARGGWSSAWCESHVKLHHPLPICNPWCWYIETLETYVKLGDVVGVNGGVHYLRAPCSHGSRLGYVFPYENENKMSCLGVDDHDKHCNLTLAASLDEPGNIFGGTGIITGVTTTHPFLIN